MLSRLPRNAPVWLDRLSDWLEPFEVCFSHVAQRGAFRRYLLGLLSDSRRKSMSAMLERVTDSGTYQSFQHFITHAPWSSERVWRQLRTTIPERTGVLILDATSFPKQGRHSVGVARQVLRHRGQGGQLPGRGHRGAVDRRARVDARRRVVSARGVADARGPAARADPRGASVSGEVAAGARVAAAGASQRRAGHGGAGRRGIRGQRDAASISPPCRAPLRPRDLLASDRVPRGRPSALAVRAVSEQLPRTAWRVVTWRNGTNRPWKAQFAALRVTPAQRWPHRRRAPEVWLLCERDLGATPRTKYYFVALPATASRKALVQLAHQRWAIEQQYQELKDELGLDHFEGRSFVGWHRHVVLTALAYAWLQHERRRAGARLPTLPVARAVITEILTAHFFVTRPHYLKTMQKLAEIDLRI